MTGYIFFDEEMPGNLSAYQEEKWFYDPNDTFLLEYGPPPKEYRIVRSGRTREGDIFLPAFGGWDVRHEPIYSPKWDQVLNCPVGHFHCVARTI